MGHCYKWDLATCSQSHLWLYVFVFEASPPIPIFKTPVHFPPCSSTSAKILGRRNNLVSIIKLLVAKNCEFWGHIIKMHLRSRDWAQFHGIFFKQILVCAWKYMCTKMKPHCGNRMPPKMYLFIRGEASRRRVCHKCDTLLKWRVESASGQSLNDLREFTANPTWLSGQNMMYSSLSLFNSTCSAYSAF